MHCHNSQNIYLKNIGYGWGWVRIHDLVQGFGTPDVDQEAELSNFTS